MDDKVFEFMEKMYSDLTKRLDGIETRLDYIETTIDKKADKADIARIENDLMPKVEIALEGYKAVYEKQIEQDNRLESIDKKLEKQDVEITVIKGSKKKVK